jgi:hypothetical protein
MSKQRRAARHAQHKAIARAAAKAAPVPPPPPLAPPPPLHRDRWAWVSVLAVLPLVIHAWGAPLGEAVAEDFDFLQRAMFSKTHTLLDGGGSTAFWRPVAHQLYYETLGPLILSHPGLVATLHILLLALSSLLLYIAFRRALPGPAAALIATFPLLSESTRTLISWPSHFVDLGLWLFIAIAVHQTAARRLWAVLLALLAALLCKEVAIVAALLLPWIPGVGPRGRAERIRWTLATGAVTAVWAVAYVAVRHHAHLVLPHQLETRADVAKVPPLLRLVWASVNSIRALFSLPAVATPRDQAILMSALFLFVIALLALMVSPRGRAALRRALPLAGWGMAWFIAASATLVPIYPIWAPNRSGFGSLGFGVFAAALLGALHPMLLGALVVLRLVAFALSPGPPRVIVDQVPQQGAFMDFERLARLQMLMRDTRLMLKSHYPTLPHGAIVGQHYLPRLAEYAYGGSKALQVWYRDSTLGWMRYADFIAHPQTPLVVIAEYQPRYPPQMAPVNTVAMRHFLAGLDSMNHHNWNFALGALAQAESLQHDTSARVFRGEIWGERATCLMFMHNVKDADYWARRGLTMWHENLYAHFALGALAYEAGNFDEAAIRLDSALSLNASFGAAKNLRDMVRAEIRTRDSTRAAQPRR